jgi:hypothetical protein
VAVAEDQAGAEEVRVVFLLEAQAVVAWVAMFCRFMPKLSQEAVLLRLGLYRLLVAMAAFLPQALMPTVLVAAEVEVVVADGFT